MSLLKWFLLKVIISPLTYPFPVKVTRLPEFFFVGYAPLIQDFFSYILGLLSKIREIFGHIELKLKP